jgi:thiamine monophosphate kinase
VASGAELDLALSGGEDFALVMTFPPQAEPPGWAVEVGRCHPAAEGSRLVHPDGTSSTLEATGWDHLGR